MRMATCLKRRKMQVTKVRLVLVLHLIGWDGGASFVDQSRNKVNQNQSNPESLLILNWKLLYVWGLIFSI